MILGQNVLKTNYISAQVITENKDLSNKVNEAIFFNGLFSYKMLPSGLPENDRIFVLPTF